MLYIVLLVLAAPITYIIIKFIQSSSPRGFARELAKAQLNSLNAFKKHNPNTKPEELYKSALTTRPGYDEEKVSNIIKGAREACKESGLKFNFQAVVASLAAYEYLNRTGNSPLPVMNDINAGVTSAIPSGL